MQSRNARVGLKLFGVYLALYGGFVFLNALAPGLMDKRPFGGVNLAILYGFALIIVAFLLAIAYGVICREPDSSASEQGGDQ